MRILLIVMLSLCAGLCITLLPVAGSMVFVLAGICLLLGLIFLIFLRKREKRLTLIFFALAIGLLLGWRYQEVKVKPVLEYAGVSMEVTGEAVDYSRPTAYGISVEAKLFLGNAETNATVYLYTGESLKPGDMFTATMVLRDSHQEGSFYGYSEGKYLTGYGRKGTEIFPCDAVPAKYFPKVIAHRLETSLQHAFSEDVVGYAMALTTGNRTGLSALSKANLKASGIYHALALSGMHMVVLVSLINYLVFKRKRLKALVGIPVCIVFTVITGCSPSVVRAMVMQCLCLLAYLFRREKDTPTSLSLSLGLLMLENPWCILNWGLQLSFLAVVGLELFSQRITDFLLGKKKRGKLHQKLCRSVASTLASTFSAMTVTVPLMAVYFGFISVISPITNILTGTVISLCFGGSLLTALLGLVFPFGGSVLGWILGWGFRYVDLVAGLMARVPFGQMYTNSVYGILFLVILYVAVATLGRKGNKRKIIPLCCLVSAYAVFSMLLFLEGMKPSVTALDVGQGQCIVFRDQGCTVVVDCGGDQGNAGDTAAEYFASMGETKVDMLILTHFDSDHVNGAAELMQRLSVKALAVPDIDSDYKEEITRLAQDMGIDLYVIRQDTKIYFGTDFIQIFAPLSQSSDNESGLSVLVDLGNLDVLLTGDMSGVTEQILLVKKDIPAVDVLIAGHHGSRNSTSKALLTGVSPGHVIISVGENRYGHPANEVLERIEAQGAKVYRTDQDGNITIKGG